MGNVLKFYGLKRLASDAEMAEYLTIRVSRSKLGQTVFDVKVMSGPVEEGDYLIADLRSNDERYQAKGARICVGKGIWGENFEMALIGLPLGYSCISVNGAEISIEIISIKRKVQAQVTDDFVQRQCLDGISTAEQYWNYRARQFSEKMLAERKRMLEIKALDIMRAHSEFANLDKQSKARYHNLMKAIQYKADRKKCDINDLLGATTEAREKKKAMLYEHAVRLAQFYEIVAELARLEGRNLECSEWDRPAQEFAAEIMNREFGNQFRIVNEN